MSDAIHDADEFGADVVVEDEETAIAPALPTGTVLTMGPFCLTVMGVTMVREATFEEWESALNWTKTVNGAVQFWLGDLLEIGEQRWGQKYSQALDATEYEEKTLRNAAWVARQIPPERRRHPSKVSYSHHVEVAGLDPEKQEYWLNRTESEGLTREQLRIGLRQEKAAAAGLVGEYWLVVKCVDEQDQMNLAAELRQQGRQVKAK
jgi:hypothetical protein